MDNTKDLADIELWLKSSDFGRRFSAQLELLKLRAPEIFACLDFTKLNKQNGSSFIHDLASHPVDFETIMDGGRGETYRKAQENLLVRAVGIRKLFEIASPSEGLNSFTSEHKIIDVLGGDGLLTRVLSIFLPASLMPGILTSDLSEDMVIAAQRYDLAALQQPAHNFLLKEDSFDTAIIAYGSHHILPAQRLRVCQESFRILKPGGHIVLHDFEVNSPVDDWFGNVVDRYSLTGHKYTHFSKEEMEMYLHNAGFQGIMVRDMYDPFIIHGTSLLEVKQSLGKYLLDMYGLVKLKPNNDWDSAWLSAYELASYYFRYDYQLMGLKASFGRSQITTWETEEGWHLEMPRVALLSSAVKGTERNM